ncbi:MAG: dihydrolipoamide acyltransferase [Oscillospiraceae bacterium]|nr:dihydrolipoamide acyltransferase [Oscillospiraceae bacterium]
MRTFSVETIVDEDNTALAAGSGDLEVFATPMMAALMENAAAACIAEELGEGNTSVGTMLSVSHVRATPVGMKVKATAELVKIEGRKYDFKVMAEDERGLIGEGTHSRVSVNRERFLDKTYQK